MNIFDKLHRQVSIQKQPSEILYAHIAKIQVTSEV